jgi:PAS domain S-box-containing protein
VDEASEFSYKVAFEEGNLIIKYVSEEFPRLTGLSNEAVVGRDSLDSFIHSDDIKKVKDHLLKVYGGEDSTCEYRLRCAGGHYIHAMDYAQPERDPKDEKVRYVHGAVSVDKAYEKATEA